MDKKYIDKLNELSKKIGNTPILKTPYDEIYVKLESANPAGSIKDRAAFNIIRRALESGALKEGMPIVEATSGNTGIGLAYIGRELGFKVVVTMPDSMTGERVELLKKYGAELILTPGAEGMNGAVKRAREIAAYGGFLADQFGNPSNSEAHYLTTAHEIFKAMPDVGTIVAGIGSGGTVMGLKRYIIENRLKCRVVGVEPQGSPLLTMGRAGKHDIEGIGANFVPRILDPDMLDGVIDVEDSDAKLWAGALWQIMDIKVGVSSGAAMSAALTLPERAKGVKILVILPDGGDRYPSDLYE